MSEKCRLKCYFNHCLAEAKVRILALDIAFFGPDGRI